MKNLLLLVMLLSTNLGGMAQKKFFDDALKKGRQKGAPYVMVNEKAKWLTSSEVYEYANTNSYLIGGIKECTINRFGRSDMTVYSVDFLPRSEADEFAYSLLSKDTNVELSQLAKRGSGYLFDGETIADIKYFKQCDDVMWSGGVVNGRIHGEGMGLAKDNSESCYVWFKGSFDNGFPVGEVTYRWVKERRLLITRFEQLNKQSITVGKTSDGMASFLINGKYGFYNFEAKRVIQPRFKSVVRDFADGIAYVMEYDAEVKINKKGKLVGISEREKLGLDKLLALRDTFNTYPPASEKPSSDGTKRINTADLLNDFNPKYNSILPEFMTSIEEKVLEYAQQDDCTFDDLLKTVKEFPNMTAQIESLKVKIYRRDFQKVQDYQQKALAAANAKRRDTSGKNTVAGFIRAYGDTYKFDPDGKLPELRELMDYYTVCEAMGISSKGKYWGYNDNVPFFDEGGKKQLATIETAQKLCSNAITSGFKDFYAYAKTDLSSKYNDISTAINKSVNDYNLAYKKYYEEVVAKREAILKTVNASNIYSYVEKEGNWSEGRTFDTDDNFTDYRTVWFKDLDHEGQSNHEVITHRYKRGELDYYSADGNYKTYADALVSAFLRRYSRSWNHNRW